VAETDFSSQSGNEFSSPALSTPLEDVTPEPPNIAEECGPSIKAPGEDDQVAFLAPELSAWSTHYKIPLDATSALLRTLRKVPSLSGLPKDARTLRSCPRTTPVRIIGGGAYAHYGLREGVSYVLSGNGSTRLPAHLELIFNVDGVALSSSSKSQFWPIMCSMPQITNSAPFIVGCFHGFSKPHSVSEYLSEFVDDISEILKDGIEHGGRRYSFFIKAFVCDAPARAFLLGIKGHSGYSSCGKCRVIGEYMNGRVSLLGSAHQPRTDKDFREKTDRDHNIHDTPLVRLPLNLVTQFPFEYMHLICLGVTKKLMLLWLRGRLGSRITPSTAKHISAVLESYAEYIPCEFARKPRSLDDIDRWKATELRQFLLYTGPIVLFNNLDKKYYSHFLLLNVAIRLLVGVKTCAAREMREYAGALLSHFVKTFGALYGKEHYSYNVHGLLHVAEDVEKFGSLDNVSAFQFENYFHRLKCFLQPGNRPLQQLSRRLHEMKVNRTMGMSSSPDIESGDYILKGEHSEGPILLSSQAQFKKVEFSNFTLSTCKGNNVCMVSDNVVMIQNIIKDSSGKCMIVGKKFATKKSLFATPCLSSKLNVHVVSALSVLAHWPLEKVSCKCVMLPHKNASFVVLPIIHSNEFPTNVNL
ncbi:hypothetical protein IscW_ISCW024921, partial [Ixodes scapularis]